MKEAEKRRKDKKLGRRQAQLESEAAEAAAFFSEATGDALGTVKTFHEMNLSRPLLKVITGRTIPSDCHTLLAVFSGFQLLFFY